MEVHRHSSGGGGGAAYWGGSYHGLNALDTSAEVSGFVVSDAIEWKMVQGGRGNKQKCTIQKTINDSIQKRFLENYLPTWKSSVV